MGALAHRFTRQGFLRFRYPAGPAKEKPRSVPGPSRCSLAPAGGTSQLSDSLCRASSTACDEGHKSALCWKLRQQSRRPRRGNRRLCLRPPYVPFSWTVSCGSSERVLSAPGGRSQAVLRDSPSRRDQNNPCGQHEFRTFVNTHRFFGISPQQDWRKTKIPGDLT
jgi:hypothetical protein